jgi:hypothetical protein
MSTLIKIHLGHIQKIQTKVGPKEVWFRQVSLDLNPTLLSQAIIINRSYFSVTKQIIYSLLSMSITCLIILFSFFMPGF